MDSDLDAPQKFHQLSFCMYVKVHLLQRAFTTHVLNAVFEQDINNATSDAKLTFKLPLGALSPDFPYLNN